MGNETVQGNVLLFSASDIIIVMCPTFTSATALKGSPTSLLCLDS